MDSMNPLSLARAQGVFNVARGAWPLLHPRTYVVHVPTGHARRAHVVDAVIEAGWLLAWWRTDG